MSMLARGKAIAPRLCKRFGGIRSSNRTISLYKKNTLPSFKDHAMQVLFPTTSPLEQKYSSMPASEYEKEDVAGNHLGRQQNHIWSRDEIEMLLADQPRHKPQSFSDHTMKQLADNPTVRSIEWRLIILESVAGVPGFVGAGFRHFRSLRALQRDHGWISTLLEEAENERMHLLVFLRMFQTSFITRSVVIGAQFTIAPFLTLLYLVHPPAVHRFVGYLEETACETYTNVIEQTRTPGSNLHNEWSTLPAPEIARSYWRLPKDATFVNTLECIFADECHHRDVNHTFADMKPEEPNPFALQHKADALRAFTMEVTGQTAWPETRKAAESTVIGRATLAARQKKADQ